MRPIIFAFLLALMLASNSSAAPKGWVCGPSGCRPATNLPVEVRSAREGAPPARHFRPFERLRARFQAMRARLRGCN